MKRSAFECARILVLGLLTLALVGCAASSKTSFKQYISKSEDVLSCVKDWGGNCPTEGVVETASPFVAVLTLEEIDKLAAPAKKVSGATMSPSPFLPEKLEGVMDSSYAAIRTFDSGNTCGGGLGDAEFVGATAADYVLFRSKVARGLLKAHLFSKGLGTSRLDTTKTKSFSSGEKLQLEFSRDEIDAHFKAVEEAISLDGFAPLASHLDCQARLALQNQNKDGMTEAYMKATRWSLLVREYLRAYFRQGSFIEISLDPANLKKELAASVTSGLGLENPSSDVVEKIDKAADAILRKVLGDSYDQEDSPFFGKVSETAFMSRAGVSYAFPAVSVRLIPLADEPLEASEVDFSIVGTDLVRIIGEASGDALAGTPSDPKATACTVSTPLLKCFGKDSVSTNVSAEEFGKINSAADKSEAALGAAIARVIRGVGWFSLNNEALAKLIETGISVIVRKATEKVMWCAYACKVLDQADGALADASMDSIGFRPNAKPAVATIRVTIN